MSVFIVSLKIIIVKLVLPYCGTIFLSNQNVSNSFMMSSYPFIKKKKKMGVENWVDLISSSQNT